MPRTNFKELLDAGVHFGHLKRKWNPAMAPYVFMERNGIHIIDLHKTVVKIDEAAEAMKQIIKSGRKVLFVATKKQAKEIVAEKIGSLNMPYITERWSGGMLTNFPTIRKAVKKMTSIDNMMTEESWTRLSKREKLQISRQRAKLEKTLGSIADLNRLPAALFVVDVMKEQIAVKEAIKLNIPIFAMVDTNSDPKNIDFVIPANDDATKSIELIVEVMAQAIKEGLSERKVEKDDSDKDKKESGSGKSRRTEGRRTRARKEPAAKSEQAEHVKPAETSQRKEETGKEVIAKEGTAKEPAAKEATTKEATTKEVASKEVASKEVTTKEVTTKEAGE